MVARINTDHALNNHAERFSQHAHGPKFTASVTFNGHSNLPYENVDGERKYRNKAFLICCTSSTNVSQFTSPDVTTLSFADNENNDGTAVTDGVFTVSVWFQYRAQNFNGLVGKYDVYDGGNNGNPGNARREWALLVDNLKKIHFQLYDETNTSELSIKYGTAIDKGTWTHCVVTYDGRGERHAAVEGCKMYINGSAVSISSGSYTASPTAFRQTRKKEGPLYVGAWHRSDYDPHKSGSQGYGNGFYPLDGEIAEIAVWSRAISATEAELLYNNPCWDDKDARTGSPLVSGAKHIWRFGNNFPVVKVNDVEVQDAFNGGPSGSSPGINGGNPEAGNYVYDRVGTAHLYGTYFCSSSDITLSSSAVAANATSRPDHADILAAANDPASLTWGRTIKNDFDAHARGNFCVSYALKPLFISSPGIGPIRMGLTGSQISISGGYGTNAETITADGGTIEAYKVTIS
tara:strand:+ start:1097 stop:2482 length:1386 start_codon:yes stop_codon:yes gene_type:complete